MRFYVFLIPIILTSCGGRVANIVPERTTSDEYFTCSHISGEHEMNLAKVKDLTKEKKAESVNNVGMLLVAPLFLDLNSSQKDEILALQKRNERLEQLSEEKNCNLFKSAS